MKNSSDLIKGMNPRQKEAVMHTQGPLLVMAGAGSGKTRVLTHRMAYILAEEAVQPWNILAITFTNKAANEMKERVAALVGEQAQDMWVSTFHSMCVRILRRDCARIGLAKSFTIIDAGDQLSAAASRRCCVDRLRRSEAWWLRLRRCRQPPGEEPKRPAQLATLVGGLLIRCGSQKPPDDETKRFARRILRRLSAYRLRMI